MITYTMNNTSWHVIPTAMGMQGKLRAMVVDTTIVPLKNALLDCLQCIVAFVLCLLRTIPVGINADPKI